MTSKHADAALNFFLSHCWHILQRCIHLWSWIKKSMVAVEQSTYVIFNSDVCTKTATIRCLLTRASKTDASFPAKHALYPTSSNTWILRRLLSIISRILWIWSRQSIWRYRLQFPAMDSPIANAGLPYMWQESSEIYLKQHIRIIYTEDYF